MNPFLNKSEINFYFSVPNLSPDLYQNMVYGKKASESSLLIYDLCDIKYNLQLYLKRIKTFALSMHNQDFSDYIFDSFDHFLNGQIEFNSRNSEKQNDLQMHLVEEKEVRKTESFEDNNFYSCGDEWWLPFFRNQDEDFLSGPSHQDEEAEPAPATKQQQQSQMEQEESMPEQEEQYFSQSQEREIPKSSKQPKKQKKQGSNGNKIKSRSETKNIPKNYGKAIMILVRDNKELVDRVILEVGSTATYEQISKFLLGKKNKMNKISDLRSFWIGNPFERQIRVLTEYFLRKKSFFWTFNSRVEDISTILKYRPKIIEGVRNPELFKHLKIN